MRCDAMHSVSLERRASSFFILGFCSILMSHIQFITTYDTYVVMMSCDFMSCDHEERLRWHSVFEKDTLSPRTWFFCSRILFDFNVAHSIHHGVRRVCASWKLCGSRTGRIRLLCRYASYWIVRFVHDRRDSRFCLCLSCVKAFARNHSEGATRGPPDGTLIEHWSYSPSGGSTARPRARPLMMCDAMRCDAQCVTGAPCIIVF